MDVSIKAGAKLQLKLLAFFVAVFAFALCSAAFGTQSAQAAETYTDDQGVVYSIVKGDTNTATVAGHTADCKTTLTIPKTVTHAGFEYTVTAIGKNAFLDHSTLTSVAFEADSAVASIDEAAFARTGLTAVDLSGLASLTTVGNEAFSGCASLRSFIPADSIATVGSRAFKDCTLLDTFTFSSAWTTISEATFQNCVNFTVTTLPDTIKVIGDNAFYGCTALKLAALPADAYTIGVGAFEGCTGLVLSALPDGTTGNMTTISARAFYGCSKLPLTALPQTVTSVGDYAFEGCSELALTALPTACASVGKGAFYNCSKLAIEAIPSANTVVNEYAFAGCTSIKKMTIPNTITSIGKSAFDGNTAMAEVVFASLPNYNMVLAACDATAFDNGNASAKYIFLGKQADCTNPDTAATGVTAISNSNTYFRTIFHDKSESVADTVEDRLKGNKDAAPVIYNAAGARLGNWSPTAENGWAPSSQGITVVGSSYVFDYTDLEVGDIAPVKETTSVPTLSITIKNPRASSSYTLQAGTDYTISTTASNPGKQVATIQFIGDYANIEGTELSADKKVTKEFTIQGDLSLIYTGTGNGPKGSLTAIGDQKYTGSPITPFPTLYHDGLTTNLTNQDITCEYSSNTVVGTATITIKGTGSGAWAGSSTTCTFQIVKASLAEDVTIETIPEKTYTGTNIEPANDLVVKAKVGGATLVRGTDYTITGYDNNIDAGTNATINIQAAGNNWTGATAAYFTIAKADINDVTLNAISAQPYTGSQITPEISGVFGSHTLTGADYTASYGTNLTPGKGTINLVGNGNFKNNRTVEFEISQADIGGATFAAIPNETYDTKAHTPAVSGTFNGTPLTSADFSVSYAEGTNINAGEVTVTITGKGNFTGTYEGLKFTIDPADLSITSAAAIPNQKYTGVDPTVVPTITYLPSGATTPVTLENLKDFDLTYTDAINAGTATVTVTGKGNWTGTEDLTYTIDPAPITEATIGKVDNVVYDGTAKEPDANITNPNTGEKLVLGTDYDLTYENNINPGTATMHVAAKGNWSGTTDVTFKIGTDFDIDAIKVYPVDDVNYTGLPHTPEARVTITDSAGVETDLTKYDEATDTGDYSFRYPDDVTNCGLKEVQVIGEGIYAGTKTFSFNINAISIDNENVTAGEIPDQTYTGSQITVDPVITFNPDASTTITLTKDVDYTLEYGDNVATGEGTVTIVAKDGGNWTEGTTKTFTFNIVGKDISTTVISGVEASYVETGAAITPTPVVTDASVDPAVELVAGTDYDVTYTNNVTVGTATITITGKGNWSGTNTATFEITASPTPITASWNRLAGGTALSTMRAIINKGWETSDYAIVATSQGYQDALSASALAGLLNNAPVLLTKSNELSSQTKSLLTSKAVKNVIIVGGTGAVSDDVDAEIKALGIKTERIAGGTATTTATAVYKWGADATKTGGTVWGKDAIVATLDSFQDALSIAPYAYAKHAPIFLTDKGTKDIRSSVQNYIQTGGFERTLIVGGTAAVSDAVLGKVTNPNRLYGGTAYTTSRAIANFALGEGMTVTNMGVACGTTYQDALVGAAFLGKLGCVIALADDKNSTTVNSVVAKNKDNLRECYIFGGTAAVSQAVEDALNAASK